MPATPKRKRLTRKEKHAERVAALELTSAVLNLPQSCTKFQKSWWNQFIGQPFRECIGPRGKKTDNAITWTHGIFVSKFCDELYPHLTIEEREQYYVLIGETIYTYLTNHTRDGTSGVQPKTKPVKSRVYAYDIWRRERPEEYERMKADFLESNPNQSDIGIGNLRRLNGALFKLLPDDDQETFRRMGSDALKARKVLERLVGEERERYIKDAPRRLKALLKEFEICADIKIAAQLLSESSSGNFRITSVATDGLKDFQRSSTMAQMLGAMQKWVEGKVAEGKKVQGGAPPPAVYGDKGNEEFPCLPDFVGLKLTECRKLVRVYITMVWMFQGGSAKVPWAEISNDLAKWIDPARMPDGAEWKDPGSMSLSTALVWLDHFASSQDGSIPLENRFQFRLVNAGGHPIESSHSQEDTGKRLWVPEKDSWFLTFTETVTQCHQPGGMRYPTESDEYSNFLAGESASNDPESPNWSGLPVASSTYPRSVIDGEEKDKILTYASHLPDGARELVTRLLDLVNEHQSHVPALNDQGPWADKTTLPALLPPAFLDSPIAALRDFCLHFWLPRQYFSAPVQPGDASTIAFFESWQQQLRTAGLLHHEPSGTLLGGYSGVVWVVVALIKLVFNFAALRKVSPRPEALPTGYDATRIPLGEWDRLLGWCRAWIEKLEADIQALSASSSVRQSPSMGTVLAPSPTSNTSAVTPTPPTNSSLPSHYSTAGPSKPTKSRPGRKNTRAHTSSDLEEELEDYNTEEETEQAQGRKKKGKAKEINYEAMDGTTDVGTEDELADEAIGDGGLFAGLDPVPTSSKQLTPQSTESRDAPAPPSALKSTDHVFGNFIVLPPAPKRPLLPKAYEPIMNGLRASDANITEAIEAWHALDAKAAIVRQSDVDEIEVMSRPAPAGWKPLFEFIALSKLTWVRAAEMAPAIFDLAYSFRLLMRGSFIFPAAASQLRSTAEIMGVVHFDIDALQHLEDRVSRGLVELRWMYDDLVALAGFSNRWATKMGPVWPPAELPVAPQDIRKLVLHLIEWAGAVEVLHTQLVNGREQLWTTLGGPLDQSRASKRTWYQFGCPSVARELPRIQACLKLIEAQNNNPSLVPAHPPSAPRADTRQSTSSPRRVREATPPPSSHGGPTNLSEAPSREHSPVDTGDLDVRTAKPPSAPRSRRQSTRSKAKAQVAEAQALEMPGKTRSGSKRAMENLKSAGGRNGGTKRRKTGK